MFFRKITGIVLERKLIKEKDALVFILSEKEGVCQLYSQSAFLWQSKNISLFQPGTVAKFWIMTDLDKLKVISGLPIKIPGKTFKKHPYPYLWALKLVKLFQILETPPGLWQKILNLENYLKENVKIFVPWFTLQFLKEIGFALDVNYCQCGRKLQTAFLEKNMLVCSRCRKISSKKIDKSLLDQLKQLLQEKPPQKPIISPLPKEILQILRKQLKLAKAHLD